jgi:hypothetical protein
MKLIKPTPRTKTTTVTTCQLVPIYDALNNQTYVDNDFAMTENVIRGKNITFAMVPYLALEKLLSEDELSIIHILLMLKLYRYNNIDLFNGIDINMIYKQNGEFTINQRLYFDLSITESQFLKYLDTLIETGYLRLITVNVYIEKFDTEYRMRVAEEASEKTFIIEMLEPIIQLEKEVPLNETP